MSLNPELVASSLGAVAGVISTMISVYSAILIFSLTYLFRKKEFWRNSQKRRKLISWAVSIINIFLAYVVLRVFIYPSQETGLIPYIMVFFIILYNACNLIIFIEKRNYNYFERGIIIFSIIFWAGSLLLGFYLIIDAITSIINAAIITNQYFYSIIKYSRLYLITTLISIINLILFILIRFFLMEDNKRKKNINNDHQL